MTQETKQYVADTLINKMHLSKEQYEEFCLLADILGLELKEYEN